MNAASRLLGSATGFLILLGCGAEGTGPSDRLLIGSWGSEDAELVAIRSGAEVRLRCAVIMIHRPIVLAQDGTFRARGRLDTSGAEVSLPRVDVTGSLSGSRITVTVPPTVHPGDVVTLTLDAGIKPSPDDTVFCPQ
jgi:hypothetical protein